MIAGIETVGSVRRAAARGRAGAGRERFTVPDQAEPAPAGATGSAARVSLGGILALQEDHADLDPDQRARAGGAAILADLGALQLASLGHGDAPAIARRLEGMVAGLPTAADPALSGILRLITLRARIEALRHGHPHPDVPRRSG